MIQVVKDVVLASGFLLMFTVCLAVPQAADIGLGIVGKEVWWLSVVAVSVCG
jgi:hypothetical protein